MAYILNNAIVHSFANDEWTTLTLAPDVAAIQDATILSLLQTYTGVVLSLTSEIGNNVVYFDLFQQSDIIVDKSRTINNWLTYIGDTPLPVVNQPPEVKFRHVEYSHAAKANYRWRVAARNRNPDASVTDSEKTDLILTRENTNYENMSKRCLVSVNGLLHITKPESYGLRILDGASSSYLLNNLDIGIYDFSGFGELEIIPITKSMISSFDDSTPLKDRLVINLNRDLNRKTVMLSLGGYLHAQDGLVYDQRSRTVVVKTKNYQFPQRIFDSIQRTYLGDAIDKFEYEENWKIKVSDLNSDDFISTYFSTSQSFAIVLNTPKLYKQLELLRDIDFTGSYETKTKPKYPMLTSLGRLCEYWPVRKGTWWQVDGYDPFYKNFKFFNQDWENMLYIEGSLDPSMPYLKCNNYLLKLYTEVISLV